MSNALLGQLEFVARQVGAKVTISLDCSVAPYQCEVRFNGTACPRGNKHEAVTAYGADALESALAGLLKRLGVYRQLPTPLNVIDRATPAQRERLYSLCREVVEIKRSILRPVSAEPRLASPRSSLHPQFTEEYTEDEEPTLERDEHGRIRGRVS